MDCDLRKPVQHKIFNVSNKVGLSNLMKNFDSFDVNDDTYFQKFKDNTSDGKLYLLTSGMKVPNPLELLSSEKFKHLIEKLRTRFDFIVIDCPPVDAVADAIPVSTVTDGTIYVVDVYKRQGLYNGNIESEFNIILYTPQIKKIENNNYGINILWEDSKGADYYTLYRQEIGGSWKTISSNITSTEYIDKTAKTGCQYTYAIKAHAVVDGIVMNLSLIHIFRKICRKCYKESRFCFR